MDDSKGENGLADSGRVGFVALRRSGNMDTESRCNVAELFSDARRICPLNVAITIPSRNTRSKRRRIVKKMTKAAVAATVALGTLSGAVGTARADLTLNGAVGLPLNPTAQIPLPGGVRVQGDYFDLGNNAFGDFRFYGLHAAGRVGSRLEINGGIERIDGPRLFSDDFDRTGLAIGAKYLFTRETDPVGVRLAAGVGYSRALLRNVHAYVVGTKSLGNLTEGRTPITGHLGVRYDRFRSSINTFAGTVDVRSNKASVYGGLEVPFTRTGDFAFVGELQSKNVDGGRAPYSASVRYRRAGKGLSASVGVQRQGGVDNGLFVQLGYSFDTDQVTR